MMATNRVTLAMCAGTGRIFGSVCVRFESVLGALNIQYVT